MSLKLIRNGKPVDADATIMLNEARHTAGVEERRTHFPVEEFTLSESTRYSVSSCDEKSGSDVEIIKSILLNDDISDHEFNDIILNAPVVEDNKDSTIVKPEKDFISSSTLEDSLKVTRRGNIRSDKEVKSIMNLKLASKKRRKTKKKRETKESHKKLDNDRSNGRLVKEVHYQLDYIPDDVIVERLQSDEIPKRRPRRQKCRKAHLYSKEQRDEYRKALNLNHKIKKKRKNANRLARMESEKTELNQNVDPQTEGLMDFLPNIQYGKASVDVLSWLSWEAFVQNQDKIPFMRDPTLRAIVHFIFDLWYSNSVIADISALDHLCGHLEIFGDESRKPLTLAIAAFSVYRHNGSKPKVETEGIVEMVDAASRAISFITDSTGIAAITRAIHLLVLSKFLDFDIVQKLNFVFGKPQKAFTLRDFVNYILETMRGISQVIDDIRAGIPISTVFFKPEDTPKLLEEMNLLLEYADRTYTGIPVSFQMNSQEWFERAERSLKTMKSLIETMQGFEKKHAQDLYNKLARATIVNRDKTVGNRKAPIVFIVHGKPGIGKSSVMDVVAMCYSKAVGRQHKAGYTFSKNADSEYYDGINTESQDIYRLSELASGRVKVGDRDPGLEELTSLADNLPYPLNMSDVKDKGKFYAKPGLILADTNIPDLNLDKTVGAPAAYRRRMIFIEVRLKDEYKKDGMMDPSKSDKLYDKWIFDLYKEEPRDIKNSVTNYLLQNVEMHELHHALIALMRQHIRVQTDLLQSLGPETFEREMNEIDKVKRSGVFNALLDELVKRYPVKNYAKPRFNPWNATGDDGGWWLSRLDPSDLLRTGLINEYRHTSYESSDCESQAFSLVASDSESDDEDDDDFGAYQPEIINSENECDLRLDDFNSEFDIKDDQDCPDTEGCIDKYTSTNKMTRGVFLWLITNYGLSILFGIFFAFNSLFWRTMKNCDAVVPHGFYVNLFIFLFNVIFLRSTLLCLPLCVVHIAYQTLKFSVPDKFTTTILDRKIESNRSVARQYFDNLTGIAEKGRFYYPSPETAALCAAITLSLIYLKTISKTSILSEGNDDVKIIEEEEDIAGGYSLPSKTDPKKKIWVTNSRPAPDFKGSIMEAGYFANRNCRKFSFRTGLNKEITAYLFGLKSNVALIHGHNSFDHGDVIELSVCNNGFGSDTDSVVNCTIAKSKSYQYGQDLWMVRLNSINFKNCLKHIPNSKDFTFRGRSRIGFDDIRSKFVNDNQVKIRNGSTNEEMCFREFYSYSWEGHKAGLCGLPLIGELNGGCLILGVHSAGVQGCGDAYAYPMFKDQLEVGISSLNDLVSLRPMNDNHVRDMSLSPPHHKSPILYEGHNNVVYYGQLHGIMARQKSNYKKSKLYGEVDDLITDHFPGKILQDFRPAKLQAFKNNGEYVGVWNIGLNKITREKKSLDPVLLDRVTDYLSGKLISNLEDIGITKMQPFSREVAINGDPDNPFVRAIDLSKAGGHGFPGKKKAYFTEETVGTRTIQVPNAQLSEEIDYIMNQYENGEGSGTISVACLKDEMRPIEKAMAGKSRVFYGGSLGMLVVQKQYLGPVYTKMVQHHDSFYCAIGADMHRAGNDIFHEMKTFSELIIEGDYSGYDTSMPPGIGMVSSSVVYKILEHFGYSKKDLKILDGILSDGVDITLDFLGDILECFGLQISGKFGTAEDNSLRNLILHIYFWFAKGLDIKYGDFFEFVKPLVYGDDNLTAVKEVVSRDYNSITYANFCEDVYGMTFTTAAKGDISESFVNIKDTAFLKRSFIFNEFLDKYTACLDLSSLRKTVEWISPSANVTLEEQLIQTYQSVLREVFLYGNKDFFESFRNKILYVFSTDTERIEDDDLITWNSLIADFAETEQVVAKDSTFFEAKTEGLCHEVWTVNNLVTVGRQADVNPSRFCQHFCDFVNNENISRECLIRHSLQNKWIANNTFINSLIQELEENKESPDMSSDPFSTLNRRDLNRFLSKTNPLFRVSEKIKIAEANEEARVRTIKYLRRQAAKNKFHSSYVTTEGDVHVYENMLDVAGGSVDEEKELDSKQLATGQENLLNITDFLARPIELATLVMIPGNSLTYSVDLWDAFTLEPSIRSKLRNYAYLSGDMNVRITVSGTPFHFSQLLYSYQAKADFNETMKYLDGQLAGAARIQALSYLSQSPISGTIRVSDNCPVDLEIPLINQQPMIRLFNNSPLIQTAAQSYNDAVGMGTLYLASINNLGAASALPTNVSINIYAWMTNVQLGAPTGTVQDITTEGDEREVGPVEKVATRLATVSNYLSYIPEIAPFAKASEIVFKGMSSLSALFGFSVPTMNTEPIRVKNDPFYNGANMIGYDTGKRIVLDPKQELTVDPSIAGITADELSFSYLCSVDTYIDTFNWSELDAAMASSLWMAPVSPILAKRQSLGGIPIDYLVAPTPMMMVSQFHEYWRGDVTFTLKVNCSQYHRGKFAVYYEPNIAQNVVIDSALDLNKQFIRVIDIQETQDVTFTVEWAFPKAWARVMPIAELGDLGTVGFLGNDLWDYVNGYISIVPFTALQSPDGSDISINVWVKSDNMCFNRLTYVNLPTQRPATEGEEKSINLSLNPSTASMAHIAESHFGELPLSFRSELKRFIGQGEILTANVGSNLDPLVNYLSPIYPPPYPAYDGLSAASRRSLIAHLRYAFLLIRGGTRHRWSLVGSVESGRLHRAKVHLRTGELADLNIFSTSAINTVATSDYPGTVDFVPHTNGGIEFETPMYTNNLFGLSFSDDPFDVSDTNVDSSWSRNLQVVVPISTIIPADTFCSHDIATGEDFTLAYFNGAPVFVYN